MTVTPEYTRQYSLAGDPADRHRYLLGVLHEDVGRGGSLKIHQMLRPGVPVVISQPRNHFHLVASGSRHLLMAGGIGVTPLIAMGHALHRQGKDFELYYKSRTRAQAAFIAELEAVPWRDRVHFCFSDERRLAVANVLGGYCEGMHLYTCGPAPFMDAVYEAALQLGWSETALHREYFSVPETEARARHPFTLQLMKSGITVQVAQDQSAVQALEQAGLRVDTKCSDGLCGVCAVPLAGGEVDHRDFVLSREQRKSRVVLCCSRAAEPGGTMMLDL